MYNENARRVNCDADECDITLQAQVLLAERWLCGNLLPQVKHVGLDAVRKAARLETV